MLISLLVLICYFSTSLAQKLTSSVTVLSTPFADTTVSWSGVPNPTTSDWIALFCTGGTYYYWVYATGKENDSVQMRLFANSAGTGCATLQFGYYSGSNVLMYTNEIVFEPMIQQIHLSMTSNATEMVIDFVSSGSGTKASCSYGSSPTTLTQYAVATTTQNLVLGNLSYALLNGLTPGSKVYYQCTDGAVTSSVFSFSAGAVPPSGGPQRIAVFADFGVNDGFGLDQIADDAANGMFDFCLHAGDFAYNFESGNGANGNFFMNRAMLYSANYPVQPAIGNHEMTANGAAYLLRHSGVNAHSNTGTSLYYSFENGLVHYLVFNSETYISGGITDMLDFMKSDLASVDRSKTPWIVAYSHKLFWMDSTDFSSISIILQQYNVSILFAGHWHYMERYEPYNPITQEVDTASVSSDKHTYTNPKFLTMIVSGAPGDVERNDNCPGDPSLQHLIPSCTAQYGYGIFTVYNRTHIYWEFTAKPTPIGGQARRPAFREQAGYTDYLWLIHDA